jgi:hypothetical protein
LRPKPSLCFIASLLLASSVGCGDDDGPGEPDATITIDSGEPDAGLPDTGPPPPSEVFGPCVIDEQCPGAGAVCRTAIEDGWPEGYCTLPCEDRGPCDDGVIYNHCIEVVDGAGQYCERRCLNGSDCGGFRENYTCAFQGDIDGAGLCVGVCSADEHCGPGAECNEWSGACHAAGEPETGNETGGTCTADEDCLHAGSLTGGCLQERSSAGTPSGWNGGYCFGPCILPEGYNSSTFYTAPDGSDELPTGTCAGDSVCFPNGSLTRRDMGACLLACRSDADCRVAEGYGCTRSFALRSGMANYSRGVCLPINCNETACPDGFTCRTIPTPTGNRYVCERS